MSINLNTRTAANLIGVLRFRGENHPIKPTHILSMAVLAIAATSSASATTASFQDVADGSGLYGKIWYQLVPVGKNQTFLSVWYEDNTSNPVNLSSITFTYQNGGSKNEPTDKTYTMTAPTFGFGPVKVGGNRATFGRVVSYSVASPVPEPETYALMLAGLGLVGWVARRLRSANPVQALPA